MWEATYIPMDAEDMYGFSRHRRSEGEQVQSIHARVKPFPRTPMGGCAMLYHSLLWDPRNCPCTRTTAVSSLGSTPLSGLITVAFRTDVCLPNVGCCRHRGVNQFPFLYAWRARHAVESSVFCVDFRCGSYYCSSCGTGCTLYSIPSRCRPRYNSNNQAQVAFSTA